MLKIGDYKVSTVGNTGQMVFNGQSRLKQTYSMPQAGLTVSSDHDYFYFWAKQKGLKDITLIHVDAHSDMWKPDLPPIPDISGMDAKSQKKALWRYGTLLGCTGFLSPLIDDGTIKRIIWLSFSEVKLHLKDHQLHEWIREANEKKDDEPIGDEGFYTMTFDTFLRRAPEFLGRTDPGKLVLGIDADRFVYRYYHAWRRLPGPRLWDGDVMTGELKKFQECLQLIRARNPHPESFMCISSPHHTPQRVAPEIISRIVSMLEAAPS